MSSRHRLRQRLAVLGATTALLVGLGASAAQAQSATASPSAAAHTVTYDGYSFMIDGKRTYLWSGEFHYYRLPSDDVLTDPTQEIELPQGWEELAVDYAVYQAMLQDGDDRWQAYKALYDEHLSDLTVTAIRFNDQAGMMNVGANGALPQWLWDEGWTG